MARIRTIKPEFFLNEHLCRLSPLHRLLFVGLWNHADRNGRLEDRPFRLKHQILPYDDCDVDKLLQDLHDATFPSIRRYEVDGQRVIEVINFLKHQRPHPHEPKSVLPGPRKDTSCRDKTFSDVTCHTGKEGVSLSKDLRAATAADCSPTALNAYVPRLTALLAGKGLSPQDASTTARLSYREAVLLLRPHPERLEALLDELAGLTRDMPPAWYTQAIRGKVQHQLGEVAKHEGGTVKAVLEAAAKG